MIIFEKITIESFGSIKGPFEYSFDSPGINLILGKNGSGKTTIFNALAWCLYKQVLKKGSSIEPWKHTQDKKYRGTMVSVNFRDDKNSYQVTRCKDFKGNIGKPNQKGGSKLFFFTNGELDKKKYKSNIQPEIEKTIGYSFTLFKNAILFGQEVERLMKESGPNKRQVFEEAFDTSFIEDAKDKVVKRLNERKLVEQRYEQIVEGHTNELRAFDSVTKDMLNINGRRIRELYREKAKVKKQIEDLDKWLFSNNQDMEGQVKELEEKLDKAKSKVDSKLSDEEFRLNMWINTKDQEYEGLRDEIKFLFKESRVQKNCPVCYQPLAKSKIAEVKKKMVLKMKELKKKAKASKVELEKLRDKYKKVKKSLESQEKYTQEVNRLTRSLKYAREALDKITPTITLLEHKRDKQLPALKKSIQKLKKEQLVLKSDREVAKKKSKKELEAAKAFLSHYRKKNNMDEWLIKDPLSTKGLRAYIFESMLKDLNDCLKAYRQFVNFSIRVYVELETARKDIKVAIIKKGQEIPYEDLSKGQKQLTEAILAFGINDAITKNKPINIFLMDEIFESLSIDNVEIISNIVMQKATKYSIHLISHLSSFNPRGSKKTLLQLNTQGHTEKAA